MIQSFAQATGKIITCSHRAFVPWVLLTLVITGAFILGGLLNARSGLSFVQYMLTGLATSGVLTGIAAYFALRIEVTHRQIAALALVSSIAVSLMIAYYMLVPWERFDVGSAGKLFGGFGILWPIAIYFFLVPPLLLAGRVKG